MNSSFCSERWNECLGLLDTCQRSRRECKQDNSSEESDYTALIQRNLDAPMPWIGLYIAAASAICSFVMAADVFRGLERKKLWVPCKYFSLNATSLTLLTVTMKLTVDLTSMMTGSYEVIANLASLVLMSAAMGNFMTSVASMDKNDILLNLTALGILVVTIAANVFIRNDVIGNLVEEIIAIVSMLVMVVVLCFSSMVVPTTKRYIESKYQEIHRVASNGRTDVAKSSVDELKVTLRRYWVMAETGCPQFVMARSVISGTSGLICLLAAAMLVKSYVGSSFDSYGDSYYEWSIDMIMFAQSVAVALGTIAPLMRCYVATWFKISEIGHKRFKDEFKIENYWTSRMTEWRERPLPASIRSRKCRKLLHQAKKLLLFICTGVMIFFVLYSKMVIFISARILKAIFLSFHHIKHLKEPNSTDVGVLESRDAIELDLIPYVLLLEGEAKLPERILRNICNELDKLIERGKTKKFKNLMVLLNKSENFNGVKEFDRNEVPSLYSQEPPNCWSLPLVTLTSIAITLPNITTHEIDQLVSDVSEGLSLVKIIEKTLDRTEGVKTAADAVWVGVELHRKWQDKDLQNTSLRGVNYKETLQNLSNLGEKIVKDFTTTIEDIVMQNPVNWPSNITAANSMYRIAQTILLDKTHQTDRNLFDRISVMIADILAASLTNLAHVIIFMCHNKTIKNRQESVRQVAVLLGESREILQLLQQRDLPCLDPEKAANIEEWRASMVHP